MDRTVGRPLKVWFRAFTILTVVVLAAGYLAAFMGVDWHRITPDGSTETKSEAVDSLSRCLALPSSKLAREPRAACASALASYRELAHLEPLEIEALAAIQPVLEGEFTANDGPSVQALAALNQLQSLQRKRESERATALGRSLGKIRSALLVSLALGLLVFLGTGSLFESSLSRAIHRVRAQADGIARRRDTETSTPSLHFSEFSSITDALATVERQLRASRNLRRDLKLSFRDLAQGDFSQPVLLSGPHRGSLVREFQRMVESLKRERWQTEHKRWLASRLLELDETLRHGSDMISLADSVISLVCRQLDAQAGTLYLVEVDEAEKVLDLYGTYAVRRRSQLAHRFAFGEGLVGQAAREKQQIVVSNVPETQLRVVSGILDSAPSFVCVTPFLQKEGVVGVLEVGLLREPEESALEYLRLASPLVAFSFGAMRARLDQMESLVSARALSRELGAQCQELSSANRQLQRETEAFEARRTEFEVREAEQKRLLERLERTNRQLTEQKRKLEGAQGAMAGKAQELELASKYKSQFLANMSHELRTPLNSLLLLARWLCDNKEGNMTDAQVQSAEVIYSSGKDLLQLIDDILDLSKIEAGRMNVTVEGITLDSLARSVKDSFAHMARDKGLEFAVSISKRVPQQIVTDPTKLQQILKNLISNALKFTERGRIDVRFDPVAPETRLVRPTLSKETALAISVSDTGVGIPKDKQNAIFEAFQQADGTTARKYGGTGLGLSICRELVILLGGEIRLESTAGRGSVFTIHLPHELAMPEQKAPREGSAGRRLLSALLETIPPGAAPKKQPSEPNPAPPDSEQRVRPAKHSALLIIDDDVRFAHTLSTHWTNAGHSCLIARTGEQGLALVKQHVPRAVFLDVQLPGLNGWEVLSRMKEDPGLRHIPVQIISAGDHRIDAVHRGAIGQTKKPVTRESMKEALERVSRALTRPKRILVVHPQSATRRRLVSLLDGSDVEVRAATSSDEVAKSVEEMRTDCLVVGREFWRAHGTKLLSVARSHPRNAPTSIMMYSEESPDKTRRIQRTSDIAVIREVHSDEHLLDEVCLFLHRAIDDLPPDKRDVITKLHDSTSTFEGKHVLLVEDDMRSAFALARLLTDRGINVLKAEDGGKALQLLDKGAEVDLILMDIMLPVMDGYETMKRIRQGDRHAGIPIIALTAKAMKEDADKCIAAGADDYLAKPIDGQQLLSMMRNWLHSRRKVERTDNGTSDHEPSSVHTGS